ncbi:MAG: hypothetical protein OXH63_15470, partial [Gemmatimonadetes bacterium]|nr:hypothetical protein [Gemmatimonadota bacterium]
MYRTIVLIPYLALSWALSACTPQDQPPAAIQPPSAPEQAVRQIAVAQVGSDSLFTAEVELLLSYLLPGLHY